MSISADFAKKLKDFILILMFVFIERPLKTFMAH
jgi:hypothetical protein